VAPAGSSRPRGDPGSVLVAVRRRRHAASVRVSAMLELGAASAAGDLIRGGGRRLNRPGGEPWRAGHAERARGRGGHDTESASDTARGG
jgi:hypothetical protein